MIAGVAWIFAFFGAEMAWGVGAKMGKVGWDFWVPN